VLLLLLLLLLLNIYIHRITCNSAHWSLHCPS
jgi:hypothetical protein